MSAIRPGLPPVLFPPQPVGQAPVPAARSDFFKMALDAVQADSAGPFAPKTPASSSATAPEDRPTRPGALLDIRV